MLQCSENKLAISPLVNFQIKYAVCRFFDFQSLEFGALGTMVLLDDFSF